MSPNRPSREKEKERLKIYRSKLKLKPNYEELKKKEAERKRKFRENQRKLINQGFIKAEILEARRLKERNRKREYRQKVREQNVRPVKNTELGPFKTPQQFGKILKKVNISLPKDEEQRKHTVKKLALAEFPQLRSYLKENKENRKTWNQIQEGTAEKIKSFYGRDDISRQAPGKRDVISVKEESGVRNKVQKRHMTMTVREAYALFMIENAELNVSLSKFYEYRPKHILLSCMMPHNVCVCVHHANFNFLVEAIRMVVKNFPKSSKQLLNVLCCQLDNSDCMNGLCQHCENDIEFALLPLNVSLESPITWKSWQNIGRPQVVDISGSLSSALDSLQESLQKFKVHCFVKIIQERVFEEEKAQLTEGSAVVQIDFAENYACISQDEIQSAHWGHQQVTIFTAVAWIHNGCYSFAIVSNCLSHDKICVFVFLKKIVEWLRNACSSLRNVTFFSDGCAAQFKNKFTMSNLLFMSEDFGVTVKWNFFATSHGKGAVDGIGGKVKRLAWEMVKTRKVIIKDAKSFYECVQKKVDAINLLFVSSSEINSFQEMLTLRWKNILPLKGIQSFHFFVPSDTKNSLLVGQTAKSDLTQMLVFKQ